MSRMIAVETSMRSCDVMMVDGRADVGIDGDGVLQSEVRIIAVVGFVIVRLLWSMTVLIVMGGGDGGSSDGDESGDWW